MMSDTEPQLSSDADWRQIEIAVDQLQAAARAGVSARTFYRGLLDQCVTLLAARGGMVWFPGGSGRWRAVHTARTTSAAMQATPTEPSLLNAIAHEQECRLSLPMSDDDPAAMLHALVPVCEAVGASDERTCCAIVELFLRSDTSPQTQQGWLELLETVAEIAAEFQLRDQVRRLAADRAGFDDSRALMGRLHHANDLRGIAFEIVNEGRRYVGADRVSLVIQRRDGWQLLAVSGVDRIETRGDVAKRLEELAAAAAEWGEPVDDVEGLGADIRPPHSGVAAGLATGPAAAGRRISGPTPHRGAAGIDVDRSRSRSG